MKPTDEEAQIATEADLLETFLRDLEGATRVVVETRRTDRVYDASYMAAPKLRAALLRACKGRVRVKPLEWRKSERGFRWEETVCGSYVIFYKSGGGATLSYGATTLTVADYDDDNMGVKCKAAAQRHHEARTLAAIEPEPGHE